MTNVSRRRFTIAASGGLANFIASSAQARVAAPLNWDDPSDRLHTMIRIMGRTDGGVAIRWIKGVLSGIVDQENEAITWGLATDIYAPQTET